MNIPSTSGSKPDIADRLCQNANVCLTSDAQRRIRERLLSEYQEQKYRYSMPPVSATPRHRLAPVIISVAFVVIIGAGIGTVSAANDAKPGDLLFGIDRAVERVQLAVTPDQIQRAKLLADIAREREQEHRDLKLTDNTAAAQKAEQLAVAAVSRAVETNDTVRAELIERGDSAAVTDLNQVRNEVDSLTNSEPSPATTGLTGVSIKIQQHSATVTLKLNAAVATFQLPTDNLAEIEQSIAQRTGIGLPEIKQMVVLEPDHAADGIPNSETPTGANDSNTNSTNDGQPVSDITAAPSTADTNSADPSPVNGSTILPAGWDITVTTQDDTASVGITQNGLAIFAWTLPTADAEQIIASISQRTGLSADQIRSTWHLVAE
ncbi:MAG: DUF5667 domain-containing protein [Patescibacteria group bacterium]|jgi:hypothetical protein